MINPVKVVTELLTKKRIVKVDENDNEIFVVSGNLQNGQVSASVPMYSPTVHSEQTFVKSKGLFQKIDANQYYHYSVDDALHSVDDILAGNNQTINNGYKRLRYNYSGSLNFAGNYKLLLPLEQYGKSAFPVEDIDYINVDVMMDNSGKWQRDIIDVNLEISSSQICVNINAPEAPNNGFKVLIVNENTSKYITS